ncbi:MAG: DEAD/DEAH box helicase [Deltaproteobacteria bacterium]
MSFEELGLSPEVLNAVKAKNYVVPTPIQEKAIPLVLDGRDVMGCAQTGTGKTAAFALPIIERLRAGQRRPAAPRSAPLRPASAGLRAADNPALRGSGRRPVRALVLTPTRELANQIAESFGAYGRNTGISHAVIYGGVSQGPQEKALRKGVDVLVATPGRLLDLVSQGLVSLDAVQIFVLDEADRMLDMGFIRDIRRVIETLPRERQTLFFSATLGGDILRLADNILRDPVEVAVTPAATTVDAVEQRVYYVERGDKGALLASLLAGGEIRNALVFTRTRHGADRVARHLVRAGIQAEAIHGDKTQSARERALEAFKRGRTRVLVATDVAARGLDIVDLSHVVNFDLPEAPDSYVHRIGRTGRAGASGVALSFCDATERLHLAGIERLIRKHLTVVSDHPYKSGLGPGRPTVLGSASPKALNPYMISADVLVGRGGSRPAGATAGR